MFSNIRLAHHRHKVHMSKSDVHRAVVRLGLNCCRSLIDRWEKGTSEPSASEAWILAKALDVPLVELFDSERAAGSRHE